METSQSRSVVALSIAIAFLLVALLHTGRAEARNAKLRTTYVVVYREGASAERINKTTAWAEGSVVIGYPGIAVAIVRSTNPDFAEEMKRNEDVVGVLASGPAIYSPIPQDDVQEYPERPRDDLTKYQWNLDQIKVQGAHAVTKGSRNVVVGVLDNGVDPHPNLSPNLDAVSSASCLSGRPEFGVAPWRSDHRAVPHQAAHGTQIAGIIAGAELGRRGIVGVAPDVRIASVKVSTPDGRASIHAAICGLMWSAERGMAATNIGFSLGRRGNTSDEVAAWIGVKRALRYGQARGVLHVAGVGDDDQNLAIEDHADELLIHDPSILRVSAVGMMKRKASYSSFGRGVVDVTAPGGDERQWAFASGPISRIFSTSPGGYDTATGTSIAAAHVTGIAALLRSKYSFIVPEKMADIIQRSADYLPCEPEIALNNSAIGIGDEDNAADARCTGDGRRTNFFGRGLVNAEAALSS